MTLTIENYRSAEAQNKYMSVHQYNDFVQCAARAKAELDGRWEGETSDAFLVGHYVEAGVMDEEGFARIKTERAAEIYTGVKNPKPRAAFVRADQMIERVRRDPLAMQVLAGEGTEQQVVLTGKIVGVPWKGLLDVVHMSSRVVTDFKTTRDFSQGWTERMIDGVERNIRVPWYAVYDYVFQLGIYRLLAEQTYSGEWLPLIVAVTKQDPPDIGCWSMEDRKRVTAHVDVRLADLGQVMAWKTGAAEAPHCRRNTCDYCRATRELSVEMAEL